MSFLDKFRKKKSENNIGVFNSLKLKLQKTREYLGNNILKIFGKKQYIDEEILNKLEEVLLVSDVGVECTSYIIKSLSKDSSTNPISSLKNKMLEILQPCEEKWSILENKNITKPYVLLFTGVNGVGKTTTIGKISKILKNDGYSVMIAACDTFRAGAIEQLKIWSEYNNIPIISKNRGTDSASVIFDALDATLKNNIDILLVDTAGRLHNQEHLIKELNKIKIVLKKYKNMHIKHETILILDANTGQNSLLQTTQFQEKIGIDSLIITKLDGTSKGGVIFPIAYNLKIPIRFIGVGEHIDDLKIFKSDEFVSAIIN